jgi:RHS repeat-associated protein
VYDLGRYLKTQQPVFAATLARETHVSDPLPPGGLKVQVGLSYSDGFGREIQKKIQAEPGPVIESGPTVSPRWVGNGWTVFNNKGKPIKQYEPFFDDTHEFRFGNQVGVSATLFYDPVERVIATLHPDHTWEKLVFDPWRQESWDVNDTALIADPKTDLDVGDFFQRLAETEYLPTWYAQRQAGSLGAIEQTATEKTELHAATPSVAYEDSLGRTFLTVAHNRFERNGSINEEKYATRVTVDIKGDQREVIDAKDRVVMRYDYDMFGTRIHQASMEAGERWMLNDVAGQPIYAWDSRDHRFRTTYDALRRSIESYLRVGAGSELTIGRIVYGESRPDPEAKNQHGKVVQLFDQAGVITSEDYDFKGNLLKSSRQLAREYKATIDWATEAPLDPEVYTSSSRFDALNRPVSVTAPDNSVYRPTFNESNLLEKVDVNLRGAQTATPFVTDIDYDAKGQRALIEYGNGTKTAYEYDPLTFRLTHLKTLRGAQRLQDLGYTYDPGGNITHIRDNAQQTIYFNNQVVSPDNDYTYDAVYRLVEAKGREHIGQAFQPQTTWDDQFRVRLPHPGDGQAMRRYTEQYEYDAVGNFLHLIHQATNSSWTWSYAYNEPSLIETSKHSNRLSSAQVGTDTHEVYAHDAHGNMVAMPHLSRMQWDFQDQLGATSRQVVTNGTPETTYYVYDATGQRVRKITERENSTRKNERIYLGGFEVYREYDGNGIDVIVERETLHVMDDQQRIALMETRTLGDDGFPVQLLRYQLGNHLDSCSLEVDQVGQIISYEEYYPYGSTSYQAVWSSAEVSLKRYRYTGLEKDEETGLAYHNARYYAPWLGRWMSCDPIGIADSLNLYLYAKSNSIIFSDPDGLSPPGNSRLRKGGFRRFLGSVMSLWRKTAIIRALWKGVPQLEDVDAAKKYIPPEPFDKPVKRIFSDPPEGTMPKPDEPGSTGGRGQRGGGSLREADHITETKMGGTKSGGTPSKGGGSAKQLGSSSTRISRLGTKAASFAFAAAMPDPTDALLLTINYFAAYGEAREAIRERNTQSGFAYGLAANLLGMSGQWAIDNFIRWGVNAGVETRVIGAEGIAESSFNNALLEGFKFGRSLSSEESSVFLQEGSNALAAKGYVVEDNATYDNVVNLGEALKPTINQALEAMREQEEQRYWAARKRENANAESHLTGGGPVPPMYSQGSNRMR